MRTAFLITSAIDVTSDPLSYSATRSVFAAEERCRQTVATLACISLASRPGDLVYVVDASARPDRWRDVLSLGGARYVSVRESYPDIYEIGRSHPNKTYAEAHQCAAFLASERAALSACDLLVKVSGRYLLDRSFDLGAIDASTVRQTWFFKRPLAWASVDGGWVVATLAHEEDARVRIVRQYHGGAWGFGTGLLEQSESMLRELASRSRDTGQDLETLLYTLTRPHAESIVHVDWTVTGWGGPNGQFFRS